MRFRIAQLASLLHRRHRRGAAHVLDPKQCTSRSPIISATTVTGLILLSSDESRPLNHNPWPGISLPTAVNFPVSKSISLGDVPQLIKETAHDAYTRTTRNIQRKMDTEGGSTVVYITASNVAVYLLWKVVPTNVMVRHFANSLESLRRGRVWTSFTSNFSHMSVFHLAANMYLLNKFGQDVAEVLGGQRFYLFYGTAGVASSLASLAFRRLTKSSVLSLGASGAVVSVLWLYACFFPDRRMAVLGSERSVSMQELVLAYTVIDAAGLLGSLGKIDFAAHLGGAVFGNFWFYLLRDQLVREQKARRGNKSSSLFKNYLGSSAAERKHN